MNLSESVYEISKNIMEDSSYVTLNYEQIERIADQMKQEPAPSFPVPQVNDVHKGTLLELVAASINYCYWYGKSTVRPHNAGSTKMYDLLMASFEKYTFGYTEYSFEDAIETFKIALSQNRFPLLEERFRHLNELIEKDAIQYIIKLVDQKDKYPIQEHMTALISLYPGFASDIFLKRASLFFIQLFRRFGWFKDDLKTLHVPADYQVPKMLNDFKCTEYNFSLQTSIESSILIHKGSLAECEIRAATILAIKKLCELTGWNVAEVDGYFFLKRYESTSPFHLTITTDY